MAPRKKSDKADYYEARHAFGVVYQGEQIVIPAGEVVPAHSPLLHALGKAAVEEHFKPVESFGRWDTDAPVEQATAGPGEKRG